MVQCIYNGERAQRRGKITEPFPFGVQPVEEEQAVATVDRYTMYLAASPPLAARLHVIRTRSENVPSLATTLDGAPGRLTRNPASMSLHELAPAAVVVNDMQHRRDNQEAGHQRANTMREVNRDLGIPVRRNQLAEGVRKIRYGQPGIGVSHRRAHDNRRPFVHVASTDAAFRVVRVSFRSISFAPSTWCAS